ncbi:vWA domain-containing protein, partial [Collinsella sp. HCP3S3_B1]
LASSGKALEVERAEVESDLSRFLNAPTDNDVKGEGQGPVDARVMICVDVSGSMDGEGLRAADEAAYAFLQSVSSSGTKIGVMYFGNMPKVVCNPTSDYNRVRELTKDDSSGFKSWYARDCASTLLLSENGVCKSCPRIGCDICGTRSPLLAYSKWLSTDECEDEADILLILTDGCWCDADKAIQDAESLKDDGVTIIGIGIADADLEFLKKISTSDSYAGLFDFSELGTAFSSIGRSISSGSGISI